WVAQERDIFPSLSVEENLIVASRPGRWDLGAIYRLFPRLSERRASRGNHLSGGEQQMLAIARALMTNPILLLLDEPLEGLAPIIVEELTAAIRRMTADEGTAVLLDQEEGGSLVEELTAAIRRMTADEGTAFLLVEQHGEVALSLSKEAIVLERAASWIAPAPKIC